MSAKRDWRTRYREKLVTAADAVRAVRREQRVFIGSGAAEPQALVQALAERAHKLADVAFLVHDEY
jgi:acyl-CoA hydrolase